MVSLGLQGRVGTRSRPGRSSPALLGCTSLGPIRHLFVLVPCQRLCRFPHPLSITLRPRPGESLARARHPSLSPPLRWDQTRSGEGEEREGGEKKTKRSRGKTQRDSLAFNLFVFIYLFPPPRHSVLQRAGSTEGWPGAPRVPRSVSRAPGMRGIKSPAPLAKEKIAERSSWRWNCAAQIFQAAQVSARASRAPPALGTTRHRPEGGNI